ncbi:MAG TPA: hypothetical protein VL172_21085, partial [Kofleriaceae bacterium]|nr:hypothetical protein [Kofleriaceae bacterium]
LYPTSDAIEKLALAGSPTGTCAAWMTSSQVVGASVAAGDAWATPATLDGVAASHDFPLGIAAGPAGCAVAWQNTSATIQGARHDGSGWSAAETVSETPAYGDDASPSRNVLQVAAGDDGFAYAWNRYGQEVYARVWDAATAWEGEADVGPTSGSQLELAASGGEYLIAHRAGGLPTVCVHDGTAWQPELALSDVYTTQEPTLTADASGFRLLFVEYDETNLDYDVLTTRREAGAWWDSPLLLYQDLVIDGIPVTGPADGATTGVLGTPLAGDPRVDQLWGWGAQ